MIKKIYVNVSVIVQIIRYKVEARKRKKNAIKTMVNYAHLELNEALLNDEEWAIKFVLEKWS